MRSCPGYRWFHFDLNDPGHYRRTTRRAQSTIHRHIFYKRFILGNARNAEGGAILHSPKRISLTVSLKRFFCHHRLDIGGNGSATTFAATAFYMHDNRLSFCIIDEVYDTENKKRGNQSWATGNNSSRNRRRGLFALIAGLILRSS